MIHLRRGRLPPGQIRENTGNKNIILATSCVFAAAWMHTGCVVLVLGYIVAYLVYNRKVRRVEYKKALIPSVVVLPLMIFVIMGFDMGKISIYQSSSIDDFMIDVYSAKTEAGSAYLQWLDISSPVQAVVFAPLKMFYFQFSPIPFDWRSLMDVTAFLLDSTVYIFLIYSFYKNKRKIAIGNRHLVAFLLVSFFVTTLVFSFGTIASGTAVRHRAKLCSFLMVCYGLTQCDKNNKKEAVSISSK